VVASLIADRRRGAANPLEVDGMQPAAERGNVEHKPSVERRADHEVPTL
jgi:hypothetical protein